MKYKNIKTGVVLETTSKIIGDAWEPVNKEVVYKSQSGEVVSGDEEVPSGSEQTEEYVEEDIDLEKMTNPELDEFAKEQGIELTTKDKQNKGTRIAAIIKAFEESEE